MDPAESVGDKTPLVGHGVQSKSITTTTTSNNNNDIDNNVDDTEEDTREAQVDVSN